MRPSFPVFILGVALVGALGDVAPAEVVSQIDLRHCRHEQCEYYVVLCARKSDYIGVGHAFVVWIEQDANDPITRSAAFGFYPGMDQAIFRFMSGKGKLVDESTKPSSMNTELLTHRMVLRVDEERYRESWDMKEHWAQAGYDYRVVGRNCLHFTYAVGRAAGLPAPKPKPNDHPNKYFDRLMSHRSPAERRQPGRSSSRRPRDFVNPVSSRPPR